MKLAVLERTIRDMIRKKTFLFIIFLQLFLVLALSMVLTNIGILFEPKRILLGALPIGIVGDSPLYNRLQIDQNIALTQFTYLGSAQEAFDAGLIDAYIYLDETAIPHVAYLTLPKSDIRASILLSVLKPHFEMHEDVLRRVTNPRNDVLYISTFQFEKNTDKAAARIFEVFFAIVIPFFFLLPGILLSSMMIDIVVEDIDKKTIPLVLMQITPMRYITELAVGVIPFAIVQVVLWMFLFAGKGVKIVQPGTMVFFILLVTGVIFLISALITMLFPHKTKSQLVYSFLLIFLFSSIGLGSYHPLRLITGYTLGLPSPPLLWVTAIYGTLIVLLSVLCMRLSHRLKRANY